MCPTSLIGSRALVVVVVLAVGCGDRAAECDARVARLERTLAALPQTGPRVPPPAGLDAPTSRRGELVAELVPTVAIDRDGSLRLDGRTMSDAQALADELAVLRRNWSLLHPTTAYPRLLHVWADRDLTLAAVRASLSRAPDHRILLLATDPSVRVELPACPASLTETCARLPTLDPASRATEISGALTTAVGGCAELVSMFGSLASMDAVERSQHFRRRLPEALRACDCARGTDPDALEYLAVVVLASPFDPIVRVHELPAPGDADATTTVGAWLSAPR